MLKAIIDTIMKMVKAFGAKPRISEILTMTLTFLPTIVNNILTVSHYSTKEKFDEVLETFDAYTGSDPGAIDIIRDIPSDKEEEFCDHFKECMRILGYHKLKINGYYIPDQPETNA